MKYSSMCNDTLKSSFLVMAAYDDVKIKIHLFYIFNIIQFIIYTKIF